MTACNWVGFAVGVLTLFQSQLGFSQTVNENAVEIESNEFFETLGNNISRIGVDGGVVGTGFTDKERGLISDTAIYFLKKEFYEEAIEEEKPIDAKKNALGIQAYGNWLNADPGPGFVAIKDEKSHEMRLWFKHKAPIDNRKIWATPFSNIQSYEKSWDNPVFTNLVDSLAISKTRFLHRGRYAMKLDSVQATFKYINKNIPGKIIVGPMKKPEENKHEFSEKPQIILYEEALYFYDLDAIPSNEEYLALLVNGGDGSKAKFTEENDGEVSTDHDDIFMVLRLPVNLLKVAKNGTKFLYSESFENEIHSMIVLTIKKS